MALGLSANILGNQPGSGGGGGSGTVTHTVGALTSGEVTIGNGGDDIQVTPVTIDPATGDVNTNGGNLAVANLTFSTVTGTVAVANGGTGAVTLTAHGVLIGAGTSAVAPTGTGTAGQVLTSGGASADPTFQWPSFSGVNSQSTAYTLALTDGGGMVYHPSADTTARTFTIPANASVAFPVGTCVAIFNDVSAGTVTVAITSDALVTANTGASGSATVAAGHIASLAKLTSTRWVISIN